MKCNSWILPSSSSTVVTVWSGDPKSTAWFGRTVRSALNVSSSSRQSSSIIDTVISTKDTPAGIVIGVKTGGFGSPSVP